MVVSRRNRAIVRQLTFGIALSTWLCPVTMCRADETVPTKAPQTDQTSQPVQAAASLDVLSQIQGQVAAIVTRTTGGIVTIEDLRGIELEDAWRVAIAGRRRGLRHQAIDALNRKADAELQVYVLQHTGKSGSATYTEAVKTQKLVAAEWTILQAEIVKTQEPTRTRGDIEQGHLEALTGRRTKIDAEITQLTPVMKPTGSRLAPLLAARTILNSQIAAVQADLTADRHKMDSDPSTRVEIPKVGSGFCIGQGYIVTTADVLDGMSEPIVITNDGSRIRSRIVGMDNETNVGLLQVASSTDMPALMLANSDLVLPGHFAISIGNQSGNVNAVALDTISGIKVDGMFSGRRFYPKLLQISGSIAAGNSGAPLLNADGQVIGIVVAMPMADMNIGAFPFPQPPFQRAPSPGPPPHNGRDAERPGGRPDPGNGNQLRSAIFGAGYAMPINSARPILADLEAGKRVQHCWIGVSVSAQLDHDLKNDRLNLVRTVIVNGVYPDSPALKAGVQKGDQILSINDRPIRDEVDVRIISMTARPGDPLTIVLLRPGTSGLAKLTLKSKADLRPAVFPRPITSR